MFNWKDSRRSLEVSQYRLALLAKVSRHRISMDECGYVALTPSEVSRIQKALKKISSAQSKLPLP